MCKNNGSKTVQATAIEMILLLYDSNFGEYGYNTLMQH